MGVEVMIYIYGAVCLCMIGFNLAYNLLLRGSGPRLERRCARLRARQDEQLEALRQGQKPPQAYWSRLERSLRRVNTLVAFDRALAPLLQELDDPAAGEYLALLQPVMLRLAQVYQGRENTQAAFFSYCLSHYAARCSSQEGLLQDALLPFVTKDSLYCRVNALHALYAFGDAERLARAVRLQDDGRVFLHEKILTEGLLTFSGDHARLIPLLLAQLESLSTQTQLAVLNYVRFKSAGYEGTFLSIMNDPEKDKELRLSAIRYFGRYPCPQALEALLAFARDTDPDHWEYATVAVASLAPYEGEPVDEALKEALHSGSWYVRSAAAQSLEARQAHYSDLLDIVAGSDRYAREMMMYRLETRRLREEESQ